MCACMHGHRGVAVGMAKGVGVACWNVHVLTVSVTVEQSKGTQTSNKSLIL